MKEGSGGDMRENQCTLRDKPQQHITHDGCTYSDIQQEVPPVQCEEFEEV